MKMVIVILILLTPIYIIIQVLKKTVEWAKLIGSPIVDGIYTLLDDMYKFWFKSKKYEIIYRSPEMYTQEAVEKMKLEETLYFIRNFDKLDRGYFVCKKTRKGIKNV